MAKIEKIDTLVDGGKASPGPAIAPKLAIMKVNIQEIFKEINEKTKDYVGMKVPVKIEINIDTKKFEIKVGTPPVASLIKKEAGIELAKITEEEKTAGKTTTGNLTFDKVVKIAKMKQESLLAKDLKAAVKLVVGTCNSVTGLQVEGKRPKDIIKEINEGKYDNLLK
jgi:large subunit ribosomal protein L11